MINCIIVEDNKADRKMIESVVKQIKNLNIVKVCEKASDVKEALSKDNIDLLFLNIPSPKHDGIGWLENIKKDKLKIIVTSSVREVAHKAYDMEAVDFILKPVTTPRIIKSVSKALNIKKRDEKATEHSEKSIFLKVNKHFVKVALKDIFLIEALADYVTIHTVSKRYIIHSTMKGMDKVLPQRDFMRVHKSYIVRLDSISEVKRESLSVQKKTVKISNTYKKELLERLQIT